MGLNVMTNINLNTPFSDLIHPFVASNFYPICHILVFCPAGVSFNLGFEYASSLIIPFKSS